MRHVNPTVERRREEGLRMKLEARDLLTAALGAEHPTVASAHQNVGVLLHLMDRHQDALRTFETANGGQPRQHGAGARVIEAYSSRYFSSA
jgi:hypothetical protein